MAFSVVISTHIAGTSSVARWSLCFMWVPFGAMRSLFLLIPTVSIGFFYREGGIHALFCYWGRRSAFQTIELRCIGVYTSYQNLATSSYCHVFFCKLYRPESLHCPFCS